MIRRLSLAAFALLAVAPIAAQAQPRVASATPAPDATATKADKLSLTFSEPVAADAGMGLVMTGMPGMADHPPMPIKGFKTALSGDKRTLSATLPRALPAGSYSLTWRAKGADGVAATGSYAFSTK